MGEDVVSFVIRPKPRARTQAGQGGTLPCIATEAAKALEETLAREVASSQTLAGEELSMGIERRFERDEL